MKHALAPLCLAVLLIGVAIFYFGEDRERESRSATRGAEVPATAATGPGETLEDPGPLSPGDPSAATSDLEVAPRGVLGPEPQPRSLQADLQLTVQVVGPDAAPIEGARARIAMQRPGLGRTHSMEKETDDQGLAHFEQALSPSLRSDEAHPGADYHWEAEVVGLFDPPVKRRLSPEDLSTQPVVLVLPAHGSVTVRAQDTLGETWTREARASLEFIREGEPIEISVFSGQERERVRVDMQDGVARFPLVGLGLSVAASVRRGGGSIQNKALGPGPSEHGQEVVMDVVLGADHPVLRLRVIDDAGRPLIRETLQVSVQSRSGFIDTEHSQRAESDSEGRILIDLGRGWSEGARRDATIGFERAGDIDLSADLPLPRAFRNGLNDLPDVQLLPPPIFVAGRVIDEAGRPVPTATVLLSRRDNDLSDWQRIWDFREVTDDEGRFEARREFPGKHLSLTAKKEGMFGAPSEFKAGETNLDVRLSTAGGIVGSVLLDDPLRVDSALRIKAHASDEATRNAAPNLGSMYASDTAGGGFRISNLPPGSWDVSIVTRQAGETLLEVLGVPVTTGPDTRDPRLQDIDLRGQLHTIRFSLFFEDEEVNASSSLSFGPGGSGEIISSAYLHKAPCELVTTHESIDGRLTLDGYLPEQILGASGDVRVELDRGLRVRVILVGDGVVPEPPSFLKPNLSSVESEKQGSGRLDFSHTNFGAPAFGEDRQVVLVGLAPGRKKVVWLVEHQTPGGGIASAVDSEPLQYVQLLPGMDEQEVTVTLTAEEADKLLGQLGVNR